MVKEIMDVKEVASYLGFSPTKIYRMLTSGEIPNVKVGGQYRFPKDVIDDWLAGKLEVPNDGITRPGKAKKRRQRPEDEIVGRLTSGERGKAKKVMAANMDKLDWQYLAGEAEKAGILATAIAMEKEINRGR